ncbi:MULTISPECIES: low specificity L-threonine aldolase [unclassified Fusibacter]|uniref:threonine aldolase family protein n=1 Tax=unclassified Fusibacter TaxID=2624464 RepID=UPI001010F375|nr:MULTISPECIES: aminotransferase class I/II-fold pyridoxal phosphate-dependent enzyme [unclassified Fusibacter]MCK8061092.1 aminotransferase class I/II-fold pyridoxal phosphate-dependent enzyme [Fusibacter sp. A2]NPE23372.1 aminotransferase class I/II-fold pyridoxal phosphate-dependent enzyme [Fusibacter sp. A1]RXV59417.1 aminotransferase class I/II-fold pyridoxal phosphate-dependent enzyme [Fusibacter sp. A1]
MLYFMNDYSEGAHQKVLDALIETNMQQHVGYGVDDITSEAIELIKKRISRPDADVHLLVTGTQTNTIAIAHFLRPYEAVIATDLGHISVHETGAIEATGHKIIEMESKDGILTPEMIDAAILKHADEHWVLPRLVYISNATETGTIYTKAMLKKLRDTCDKYGLYLYIDGARLANALTCDDNDMTIEDIANFADAFTIGGTKNGILFGEALVITNPTLKEHMRFSIKQRGALLAKGRLLGVQFKALFEDDLYFKMAKHTNEMATMLKDGILNLGYQLMTNPSTNLLFVILPNSIHEKLSPLCYYEAEHPYDENNMEARFVTSWATPKEDVLELLKLLKDLKDF